jgi:hypothetical protein
MSMHRPTPSAPSSKSVLPFDAHLVVFQCPRIPSLVSDLDLSSFSFDIADQVQPPSLSVSGPVGSRSIIADWLSLPPLSGF